MTNELTTNNVIADYIFNKYADKLLDYSWLPKVIYWNRELEIRLKNRTHKSTIDKMIADITSKFEILDGGYYYDERICGGFKGIIFPYKEV